MTRVNINPERLCAAHREMAQLGATGNGGVNRAALTEDDIEVHRRLAERASQRGFAVEIDDFGNQFMRRPAGSGNRAALASGSHSDSQPTGGRFDGIYGVLAAFEVLEAVDDAGLVTRHPLEAVIWNNEEGVRFLPTAFGSAVHVGNACLEEMLAARDGNGITMAAAVASLRAAIPKARPRALATPLAGFVEAHIEQGPNLEERGCTIGLVTGIQGTRKFSVEVIGEEAHAGTTPRRTRRDAFFEAIAAVNALHQAFEDPDDVVRFTIGQFEVFPGALAVVPGRVSFRIDFRHPDAEVLQQLGDRVAGICRAAMDRCRVEVVESGRAAPTAFEGAVPRAIRQAVTERGLAWLSLPSGAGHDARHLARFCPTGMIFIPCAGGISHNEREHAADADLVAGAQVLADTLLILDDDLAGPGSP